MQAVGYTEPDLGIKVCSLKEKSGARILIMSLNNGFPTNFDEPRISCRENSELNSEYKELYILESASYCTQ